MRHMSTETGENISTDTGTISGADLPASLLGEKAGQRFSNGSSPGGGFGDGSGNGSGLANGSAGGIGGAIGSIRRSRGSVGIAERNAWNTTYTVAELEELNREFEHWEATDIIKWSLSTFAPNICITSSMQNGVLIHLTTQIWENIEVVFIDTGYHFPETMETVETMRLHFGLNLRIMSVPPRPPGEEHWVLDPKKCCSSVKVGQLDRALLGKSAWMSGLRRADSTSRAEMPVIAHDVRGLVKINPIINWSNEDMANYIAEHNIPYNPLLDRGYPSIGCAPCTTPVSPGDDIRSGRWAGQDRSECGMHI